MSLKTDPMPSTPFPEDSGILGRHVSLVDRWFPTFRNIVMLSSSRCFDLTLEDEGTATFETSGTTHPRTSRPSNSRRRNAQLHVLRGNPFTGSKQLTAWSHTHTQRRLFRVPERGLINKVPKAVQQSDVTQRRNYWAQYVIACRNGSA